MCGSDEPSTHTTRTRSSRAGSALWARGAHVGGRERAGDAGERGRQRLRRSRCCRTRAASRTSATSSATPWATRSRTSIAGSAGACCTRWATTPSGCPPRTTRSRPGCTRATRPPPRSPRSSASSAPGGSRSTGRASWRPPNRATTAGRSGSSCSCSRPGLAYRKEAAVKWCPHDQTVLANEQVDAEGRCERCGATWSRCASSSSGSCASPTTPSGC